jgi:hypothetical protein
VVNAIVGSTWPTVSRWWWCATTTRGCWRGAHSGARPGISADALEWASDRAVRAGFAGVTVACEPTGHRWRVLGQLAGDRGMSFVCVQPAASAYARRTEDLTSDKTDDKDAVLIARLTAQLRCYLPEPVDPVWGRLRHLGAGGSSCWSRIPGACSRSAICSSACGPAAWTRPRSRSSRRPGSPR